MESVKNLKLKYSKYVNFIEKYKNAANAASGSEVDANANVEHKNVTTCTGELYKKEAIGINRLLMTNKITELYGEELAEEYIRQLDSHEIYRHDETNPMLPYTYAAQESVVVKFHGKLLLVSFEDLYDLCEEQEYLLDEEKEVYAKYPTELYIRDRNNEFTTVARLIKKKRHRDLVVIKTTNGENLIVTDNHPMIVSDDIEDTVEAINSTDKQQYREKQLVLKGDKITKLPLLSYESYGDTYVLNKVNNSNQYSFPYANLTKEFGYFIGFFIAEGYYSKNQNDIYDSLIIKQKGKKELLNCAEYLFNSTGIYSYIYENTDARGFYCLRVTNRALVDLFLNVFRIAPTAQNKRLPLNVLEYNEDFLNGIIAGIIDGDGCIDTKGGVTIRLSSRTCISQLSQLLGVLDMPCSMTYYDGTSNLSPNRLIKEGFPTFGISFTPSDKIDISVKCNSIERVKGSNYKFGEWTTIKKVIAITNEKFLEDNEYIYDITTESHTFIMNNIWVHNCVSITMYPFLFEGTTNIGGNSEAPKHLDSFCGSFVNLVYAIASQFAGAVATPEFLMYMDYFIRKDYGNDYYKNPDKIVEIKTELRSLENLIENKFQQVIYTINDPAGARNFQSVFWNIAYFDKPYFNGMFSDFAFPDGSTPNWDSLNWLQKKFMKWFNSERLKKILTFPVETVNLLNDGEKFVDDEWYDFASEMWSEGHSFFCYTSDSVDSLASCCRLKNEISENTFSYTLGAGGVSTGSKGVITININRLVQNKAKEVGRKPTLEEISEAIYLQVEKIHKYMIAYNELVKDNLKNHMLPVYDAGYISMEKQYLTIGINGFVESAEFMGIEPNVNEEYFNYGEAILKPIYTLNKKDKTKEIMFNTEFVPAENLGVKNANWDKEEGYFVPRDCYNSYFYRVEDDSVNILDKFILHGKILTKYLDGGSALHANLSEHLTKDQYKKLLLNAIETGCSYFTFNIPNTICNNCGHISKHKLKKCPCCGSENLDYATRVIGYLKRVSTFSQQRQKEESMRYYE